MINKRKSIPLPRVLRFIRQFSIPYKLGLLERLYGSCLAREGIGWVEASNGVVWKLDLAEPCQRWIVYGDYEGPLQMEWLRQWFRLSGGGVVIDSGANIGQMALFLGPLPGVQLIAFEPLPEASDWLEECLQYYPQWAVRVIRQGLSSANEELIMQVDGARSTSRTDWYRQQHLPMVSLPMTTLDKFLEENSIPSVRLWKLDVEGHELQALEGARRHLKRQSIAAILVELSELTECERLLRDCGYALFRILRRGRLERFAGSNRPTGNLLALPTSFSL